jgi:uncharacterized protein with PIN domain
MKILKTAYLRFYAELNDFLPACQRQQSFTHHFEGRPAIKDVIEGCGVPHTEVDLILVHGKSVGFDHHLKAGDVVSVYPVFESFDIASISRLRSKPLRDPKFIADVHLGRLARYLRMLGFDTRYRNDYADPEIIRIAISERRIVLTRDRGILKHKAVTHGYFVHAIKPSEQIQEVLQRFDLYGSLQAFKRCIPCNGNIVSIDKKEIWEQLQPRTRQYYDAFFVCEACRRIYWQGSHYKEMQAKIADLLCKKGPSPKRA